MWTPFAKVRKSVPVAPLRAETAHQTKIRRVHLHGAKQAGGGESKATVSGVSGDADISLEISERTLSEIASFLLSANLSPAGDEHQSRLMLRKVLEGADETRVRRAIRDLHRLEAFTGQSASEVSVSTLCRFLLEVSKRGPTAAAGVWHQLDWWRCKFGLLVLTRQPYAVAFRTAKPGAAVTKAPELQPGALLKLVTYSRSGDSVTHQFAQLVVLVTVGCIRFRHQARSRIIEMDETLVTFRCALGKSKTGGVRRPFIWIVPRCLEPGIDTLGGLATLLGLGKPLDDRPTFVVPDIRMKRSDRAGIFDERAEWLSKPMPYAKFVELTKGLLLSLGMDRGDVLSVKYNALRRALPSIGEAADFSGPEMQSLSNWAERAKGSGGDGKLLRATHPTSRSYAAGIFHSAAINRQKAVIICHMAATAIGVELSDVKCNSVPLKCILRMRGHVEAAEELAVSGPPWALSSTTGATHQAMDLSRIATLSEARESVKDASVSSDDSSSSSSSDTDSSTAVDVDDAEPPLPFRVREGGKVHLQHFISAAGAVPYCRDSPFSGSILQESVEWRQAAQWETVCKSCRQRLPASITKKLDLASQT